MRFVISGLIASLMGLVSVAASSQDTKPAVGEKFGAWTFHCQAITADHNVCAIVQTVVEKKSQRQVMRAVVRPIGKEQKRLGLFVTLPLGIHLAPGVAGKVDDGEQFKFIMQRCTQNGCEAAVRVDDKLKSALENGNQLVVGFKPSPAANAKPVGVRISLNGFTAGTKQLMTK